MGSTELKSYGLRSAQLNDKQTRFVMEYLKDSNGTRAAKAAGYSSPTTASSKLLKKPLIARAIGRAQQIMVQNLGLDAEEVIYNLWCCVTRTLDDFIDEDGKLISNVNKLTDRAKRAVDGIDQEITITHNRDGTRTEKIRNKLKLVSKSSVLDMAMKHKGLFAEEKVMNTVAFKWDELYQHDPKEDLIEQEIDRVQEED